MPTLVVRSKASAFEISNPRLNPPGIEAIVVVLAADLAVAKLEEDGHMCPQLRVRGQTLERNREQTTPENFNRDPIAIGDRVQHVVLLVADDLFSLTGGIEQRLQSAVL